MDREEYWKIENVFDRKCKMGHFKITRAQVLSWVEEGQQVVAIQQAVVYTPTKKIFLGKVRGLDGNEMQAPPVVSPTTITLPSAKRMNPQAPPWPWEVKVTIWIA